MSVASEHLPLNEQSQVCSWRFVAVKIWIFLVGKQSLEIKHVFCLATIDWTSSRDQLVGHTWYSKNN